jgi:hypothetical protein
MPGKHHENRCQCLVQRCHACCATVSTLGHGPTRQIDRNTNQTVPKPNIEKQVRMLRLEMKTDSTLQSTVDQSVFNGSHDLTLPRRKLGHASRLDTDSQSRPAPMAIVTGNLLEEIIVKRLEALCPTLV